MTKLAKARDTIGLSQENMAHELGISKSAYCDYENGKKIIPGDVTDQLCEILHIGECRDDFLLPVAYSVREHAKKMRGRKHGNSTVGTKRSRSKARNM